MHTMTTGRGLGPLSFISRLLAQQCGVRNRRESLILTQPRRTRPSPRHPARHATNSDGRFPGSRVYAHFPPSQSTASGQDQWLSGRCSSLTVAGAAVAFTTFPRASLLRGRPSGRLVHRRRPCLSIESKKFKLPQLNSGCCRGCYALPWNRFQVLCPSHWVGE
jgi:hypothetical protein